MGSLCLSGVRNAPAYPAGPEENHVSRQSIYTIQAGSFKDSRRAEKQFRMIEQSLEGIPFSALRIEKVGLFYAVRIGKFSAIGEAERFLRDNEERLQRAMVMKAYFIDERIVMMRAGAEEGTTEAASRLRNERYLRELPYAPDYLGLRLVGTALLDQPGGNVAIMEDLKSGVQELYKKGDALNGALIKKIMSKGVIIEQEKGDEMMIMVEGKGTGTAQPAVKTRKVRPRRKADKDRVPSNGNIMRGIGTRPYMQEGKPAGFSIYNINAKSVLGKAGIQNCDVITAINGKPVESPANFSQTLKKGGEITLDIKRDDTSQKLTFDVK